VFIIQLKPTEQHISIPELINRIARSRKYISGPVTSPYDEIRAALRENEQSAKYRLQVERAVNEAVANGWLEVTTFANSEFVKVGALVAWMLRCEGSVTQSGVGGRESYADASLGVLLERATSESSPPSDTRPPLQRLQAQEDSILAELKRLGCNLLKLPKPPAGKSGVKKDVRTTLLTKQKHIFVSKRVFDDAWQRLRDKETIGDE